MIDMASVYAERYKQNPQALQAAVMGQSPDPKLDPYTALNALKLVKESQRMAMAGQAQQPTSSPSIVAENVAPPPMMQGLGAMVPGAMGQAPQGMPQRPPMPQPTMQAASGGLAGMYTPEEDYAAGGIVAFDGANGSFVRDRDGASSMLRLDSDVVDIDPELFANQTADGGDVASPTTLSRAEKAADAYMAYEPKEMTAKEQETFLDSYMARMKKASGPDIYAPAKERLTARETALAGDRKFGEGMAYLTAAGKVLKGRSLAEGASEALPAFAQQLGEARRAEQQEKRAIEQMNFSLADAERKERMGDARGAQAALSEARKFQQDANRAKGDKLRFSADIAARTVQYSKTTGKGAGAGAGPKYQEQLYADNVANLMATSKPKTGESPEAFTARVRAEAGKLTAAQLKTSTSSSVTDTGPNKTSAQIAVLTAAQNRKVMDRMAVWETGLEKKKAEVEGPVALAKARETAEAEFRRQAMQGMSDSDGTAAPTANPRTVIKFDKTGKQLP